MKIENINLNISHQKHFVKGNKVELNSNPIPDFAQSLSNAFNKVNNLELNAQNLQVKMITDPDSVSTHEISLAQTKAELALSFAKSISTRVISAFNELTNLR